MRSAPTPRLRSVVVRSSRRENTHRGSTASAARRSVSDEADEENPADSEGADALRGAPVPGLSAFEDGEDEQAERHGEEGRAEVVDLVFAVLDRFVEGAQQHPRRQHAQRDVDVEDPAPAEVLGEEAAEGGADDGGDRPDAREVALHPGAFGDGVDVAGDGDGHGLHGSGAEALECAECDECRHAPGEAAEDRAEQEQADAEQDDGLAADDIRQFGVDGHRHRLGEQVDGEQPGELVEAAEVFDDRRDRGGEDGGVDRDEPRREHEGDEDRAALGAEADAACRLAGVRGGGAHGVLCVMSLFILLRERIVGVSTAVSSGSLSQFGDGRRGHQQLWQGRACEARDGLWVGVAQAQRCISRICEDLVEPLHVLPPRRARSPARHLSMARPQA